MTGTFPPALTAVHEPGTRAKMATIREVHSSLPIPSERIVRWLFTEHVGAPDMTSPWPKGKVADELRAMRVA